MTAKDLQDHLNDIKKKYGTLDVPIMVWKDHNRFPIELVDTFTDGQPARLHSIDLNLPLAEEPDESEWERPDPPYLRYRDDGGTDGG